MVQGNAPSLPFIEIDHDDRIGLPPYFSNFIVGIMPPSAVRDLIFPKNSIE